MCTMHGVQPQFQNGFITGPSRCTNSGLYTSKMGEVAEPVLGPEPDLDVPCKYLDHAKELPLEKAFRGLGGLMLRTFGAQVLRRQPGGFRSFQFPKIRDT